MGNKKIKRRKDNSHGTQMKSRIPSPSGRGTESEALQGEVKSKNYIVVEFTLLNPERKELLSTLLPDYGFEGIEELEASLKCYIPEKQFSPETLKDFLHQYNLTLPFTTQILPDKNWNEEWEKSYEPIIVSDSVIIKASFHQTVKSYPFEILVDPQMSFGTGHHETTQLMAEAMLNMDFESKSALDFGSGTGVLSVLAHKMKAKRVVAVDNDEWAYNNIKENIGKNAAATIEPLLGGAEVLPREMFEVVLANVNKNILLENMEILLSRLIKNGIILFSGLLLADEREFVASAEKNGLILLEKKTKNEWLSLKFQKR